MSIFRFYLGLKLSFEHTSARKNLFLSAWFCWHATLFLREMDQKHKFAGTIVYGDSYLEFLFCHSKVIRLHATIHNAASAVQAHIGRSAGYCYMIDWRRISCLIGHMIGLQICLYVRIFLPSIFNSVDFWSSMFCTVLDNEAVNKNVFVELGLFKDRNVQGFSFCLPKRHKLTKQAFWSKRNLNRIVWNSGNLDYSELQNVVPKDVKVECFAKTTKNASFRAISWMKTWKTWMIMAVQEHVERQEEMWLCSSYLFRHKTTVHWAEYQAKLFDEWTRQQLRL